jgi:hypothetical protein
MEPLEQLREKIHGFPGYGTHLERRRSDEYVRSYLGEALTDMAARCTLTPDLQSRVDALVLRVAFADPKAFATHDGAASDSNGAVAAADVETLELADRARSVDAQSLSGYIGDVAALLDRRDAALRAAAHEMT